MERSRRENESFQGAQGGEVSGRGEQGDGLSGGKGDVAVNDGHERQLLRPAEEGAGHPEDGREAHLWRFVSYFN